MTRTFKRDVVTDFFSRVLHERSLVIPASIRDGIAWRCLSPNGKVLLLEMIDVYNSKSHWGKRAADVLRDGFEFVWGDCREVMAQHTFHAAREDVVAHGFFSTPLEHQRGTPMIFKPSAAWRAYKPTDAETQRLERATTSKTKQIRRHKDRRRLYLQQKTKTTADVAVDSTADVTVVRQAKPKNNGRSCRTVGTPKPKNNGRDCRDLILPGRECRPGDPKKAKKLHQVRERVRLENIAASKSYFGPELTSRLRMVGLTDA